MINRSVIAEFVRLLKRIADEHDRAKCAQLRRSLSYEPGTCFEVMPYLGPIIGKIHSEQDKRAVYLVAGWYGLWRSKVSGDSWLYPYEGLPFGRAMRSSLSADSFNVKKNEEKNIARLLNLDASGLEILVPLIIGKIARYPYIFINWGQLLEDVASWGEGSSWSPPDASRNWIHPSRRWAEDFWKSRISNPSNNDSNDLGTEKSLLLTVQKDIVV